MKVNKKFKGIIVPVVAPITSKYELDVNAVEKIFNHLYAHHAIPFILGTTGESASLSNEFKEEYLKTAAKLKPANGQLYVGISSNIVKDSIEFAKQCFDLGVDAVAATLPTYYKLSDEQIKGYFLQLADSIPGPLVIYNIPATTHMSIPLSIIEELSYHENIVATKDSERSVERLDESLKLWKDREDFSHFIGWAGQSAYALVNGSDGLVPSTGNFAPSVYYKMMQAVENGDNKSAFDLQNQSDLLGNLYQAGRSLGESLWGLKVLMKEFDLCEPIMMPPLHELSDEDEKALKNAFYELIKEEKISLK